MKTTTLIAFALVALSTSISNASPLNDQSKECYQFVNGRQQLTVGRLARTSLEADVICVLGKAPNQSFTKSGNEVTIELLQNSHRQQLPVASFQAIVNTTHITLNDGESVPTQFQVRLSADKKRIDSMEVIRGSGGFVQLAPIR